MFLSLSSMHIRGQEEDLVHTDLILKFSETKLWSIIYVESKTGHFGNEISLLIIKIANNRNKE
jgi:RNA binding exosome subunit